MADHAKWQQIEALELTQVKERLKARNGWWWSLTHNVNRLESEYRQFLYLIAENQDKTVVPWSEAMDEFWHEHILDTRKYEADCLAIFGQVVHHNPHLTKGSPKQREAFRETKTMYISAFGNRAGKNKKKAADQVGCGAAFPLVFCASDTSSSHGDSCGGHGDSSGGHGGGASCGSSCGSSCGGGGCGGGCGGGG